MTLSMFDQSSWWDTLPVGDASDPDRLYWYQRDAYDRITYSLKEHASTLLMLATGLGKTRVFGTVAKHWDGPVLILAHRDELVQQARVALESITGEFVDIEQGDFRASHRSRLVVGSVQSFHQSRLERMAKDRYSLVIFDECHRARAESFRRAFEYFTAKRLGVTATPDRGDEKALGDIFADVAYSMDIEDGISQGHLVPIRGTSVHLEKLDLDAIGKSKGDLVQGELDVEMAKVIDAVTQKLVELAGDRRTIAFFPGVKSAELAMMKLNERKPDSACFVCAMTPELERRTIVRDFKAGRYQFFSNCDIASEGFDCPEVSCVANAAPTLSRGKYAQRAGRGTRPLPGTAENFPAKDQAEARRAAILGSRKTDMLLLDFVGDSQKHSLVAPEDLLGGNYSDDEVSRAKKLKEGGAREPTLELLQRARAELVRLAKVKTIAKVKVKAFDPFAVMGISMEDDVRYSRFGVRSATPGQIAALQAIGVPNEELNQLSRRGATHLLDEITLRRKKKLCTFKQLKVLQKFGVTDTNIPFDRANAAMTYLNEKGWGSRGAIDGKVLQEIILHRREIGEDG
jgi:superfamily II DNA or RNA helicase